LEAAPNALNKLQIPQRSLDAICIVCYLISEVGQRMLLRLELAKRMHGGKDGKVIEFLAILVLPAEAALLESFESPII